MGVAHNIIERIDVEGKDCLVIGCGPVGLFAVACAKGIYDLQKRGNSRGCLSQVTVTLS